MDEDKPGLAMTRSLGDIIAKKIGVISEPDIFEYEIKQNDKFIVIASDGIWEYLTNEEVVNIISSYYINGDVESATEELIKNAKSKWEELRKDTIDDITVIVIFLETKI